MVPASGSWCFCRGVRCAAATATIRTPGSLPGGRSVAVGEILDRIDACRNFIRSGGVTLSGGEPLLQPEFVRALLAGCGALGFHTALDTAAPLPPRETFPVAELADLILLDIKAADPALCRELTGRDNRNAFALLDYL